MKIMNSQVAMASYHEYARYQHTSERSQLVNLSDRQPPRVNKLEISEQAREAYEENKARCKEILTNSKVEQTAGSRFSPKDKLKKNMVEKLLSGLTGKDFRFKELELNLEYSQATLQTNSFSSSRRNMGGLIPAQLLTREATYGESEKLSFAAEGIIQTADGREIEFAIELNMSREFISTKRSREIRPLVDPLIVNYEGAAAELTETKFSFDLDFDGSLNQLSILQKGSGFLAWDRNGDGQINNGRELFGARTGDGFAELAADDEDENGWIDENDSIFEKLRIWTRDAAGKEELLALGQKGIGAIFLGRVAAPFALQDSNNQQLGQAVSAGLFIREDGSSGSIQQVDFVI